MYCIIHHNVHIRTIKREFIVLYIITHIIVHSIVLCMGIRMHAF